MVSYVLRLPRSDSTEVALVNVDSSKTDDLDLEIEGTEGTTPYVANFKHGRLLQALSKNSTISATDWEITLRCTLLQKRPQSKEEQDAIRDVELVTHISDDQLVLTFRKNISGIHRRIAELPLLKNEDHELDTIAWISTAALRSTALEDEVRGLNMKFEEQGKAIQRLTQHLENLVKAKADHEQELLEKFSRLLNAKKLKIRDQQRLLAGSTIDAEKAAEVGRNRGRIKGSPSTNRFSGLPMRSHKRKHDDPRAQVAADPEEESDDFEDMNALREQKTPEKSDLDEMSDAEDESDADVPHPAPRQAKIGRGNKGKALETQAYDEPMEVDQSPPPTRALPFSKTGGRKYTNKEQAVQSKTGTNEEAKKDAADDEDNITTEDGSDYEL